MNYSLFLVGVVAALAACTEQPQTLRSGNRPDTAAFQGTGLSFAAPGWKQGDKVSWEQQIKSRALGQNEYNRTAP